MELNIAATIESLAVQDPSAPALVSAGRTIGRGALAERTSRLANVLGSHGIGVHPGRVSDPRWESPHDHVALYLHNGPEYLESMLATWKARGAPFNVNYRYVEAELRYLLDDASTAAIVVHDRFAPALASVLPTLATQPLLVLQVADGTPRTAIAGALDYEEAIADAAAELDPGLAGSWSGDDLYLCYTGGTTAMPKGTMWRQADFAVAALGVRRPSGEDYQSLEEVLAAARPTLRTLPAPPFMHGAAHWNALSSLMSGGAVVIQDVVDRFDPTDVLDTVERDGVTSLLVVGDPMAGPLVDTLRAEAAAGRRRDLHTLRHLLSGGAVLSPRLRAELLELLPEVTIVDVLGSTESGRQAVARLRRGSDVSGDFAPEVTTVVLSEDRSRFLHPGDGEDGWLARSGRVPLGYLGDESATRRTFPVLDGQRYAVAGDRALLNSDGSMHLLGRESVCINTGGEKVFAEEVESAIKSHPAVFDAVVCGRPSQRWGEEVVAIVALREAMTATDEELRAVAGQSVARYKLPKAVLRVDEVVRSPSGKADYRWARSLATA